MENDHSQHHDLKRNEEEEKLFKLSYYILSIKILEHLVILLTEDQVDVKDVFTTINNSVSPP